MLFKVHISPAMRTLYTSNTNESGIFTCITLFAHSTVLSMKFPITIVCHSDGYFYQHTLGRGPNEPLILTIIFFNSKGDKQL